MTYFSHSPNTLIKVPSWLWPMAANNSPNLDTPMRVAHGLVIVVHGFNKKARDMQDLADALEVSGWSCLRVNLPTLFGDEERCVEQLHHQVCAHLRHMDAKLRCSTPVHFVAHSLGGLIVRRFIAQHWHPQSQTLALQLRTDRPAQQIKVGHCVFIATPHKGSRLADIAVKLPGYRRTFKPIDALLPSAGYQRLPQPRDFKLGLIAGAQSAGLLGRLLQKPNDGHVEVASAQSPDADDMQILPYHHKNIHHQPRTLSLTHEFLVAGTWQQDQS